MIKKLLPENFDPENRKWVEVQPPTLEQEKAFLEMVKEAENKLIEQGYRKSHSYQDMSFWEPDPEKMVRIETGKVL